ncbi:MAG TPA: serine/threonine-protein kinase [Candidatus Saccharimonadales bacterium]|nr:serine/threonine-protein kinase [Candidatus Saccharimonadales bacterium]
MNPSSPHPRRDNWIGAALAAGVGLLLLCTPLGLGLEELSYDLGFLFRRAVPPGGQDVVIVYMDWDSHVRLGQERFRQWDRGLHARLLDRLNAAGAKAVVFDIIFLPATNTPAADQALAAAARRMGKVAVGAMVVPDVQDGQVVAWRLIKPFPELESAARWGVVEVGSEDRSLRQHYFRRDYDAPSLAWRAAQLALPTEPPDPYRERWINFYGPPGTFAHHSYWQALAADELPAGTFSNKVVFVGELYDIGMTGGKGTDDFRTPYTRWTGRRAPGVEVNATTFLNLVRGDWLSRLPLAGEAGIAIGVAGLLAFALVGRTPLGILGWAAGSFVFIGAIAILAVGRTLVWFPWLIPALAELPLVAGWALLSFVRRVGRERESLLQQVAVTQAALAHPMDATTVWTASAGPKPEEKHPQIPDHQLVRCIGRGGYGEVWLALDAIHSYHAVKVVYRRTFRGDDAPYEREFNGLRKFTPISRAHPGLVHVLHVGRHDGLGYIYYVMELADDATDGRRIDPATYAPRTLLTELRRHSRLPLGQALQLGIDLAAALEFLHGRQLIHRDIKPANIIFVDGVPKLADIGLVTDAVREGGEVTSLGTRGYIPPEGPGTAAGDVYSLGKLLYEAAVGLPVDAFPDLPTGVMEQTKEAPVFALNEILCRACENEPSRRYPSAAALAKALTSLKDRLTPEQLSV